MATAKPEKFVPETSDEGRREFTVAMQLKLHGELGRARKRFAVSMGHYREILAEIHFQTGDCLFKGNDWVGAAEQFGQALQLAPNHPRAKSRLKSCRHLVERSAKPETVDADD